MPVCTCVCVHNRVKVVTVYLFVELYVIAKHYQLWSDVVVLCTHHVDSFK